MPKYVRVIDENSEYITTEEIHNETVADLQENGYDYEGGIINYADTIEELCDEFILFDDKGKPHYKSVEKDIWYIGAVAYIESVRGAIWTDKGLIYVAKMNEKGELELL